MCLTFKSFLLFKLSSKLGNQKLSAKLSSNNKKSPCVAKTILYFFANCRDENYYKIRETPFVKMSNQLCKNAMKFQLKMLLLFCRRL